MYRRFIATVAAASIAITAAGALPARASEDDTARLLAAILGLAVVGKIVHDNKKDRDRAKADHRPAPVYTPPEYRRHKPRPPRYTQPDLEPRPLPRRVDRKLLPGQCLRSYRSGEGRVRMFGRKCLKKNYRFSDRLPRQCLYIFDTPRGDRRGYEARCLRQRGYKLAHR